MYFVIRDDDTCAYTAPEELEACYKDIWGYMTVSLSTTPFRIPGNDIHVPDVLKGNMQVQPLENNPELVSLLKSGIREKKIDISLHGYHHCRHEGEPEFVGANDLSRKALHGKTHLEALLGVQIKTFVPPNNSIERRGLEAVVGAGMNVTGIRSLFSTRYRNISLRAMRSAPKYYWHTRVKKHQYPYLLNLGDHKEVSYHTFGPNSSFHDLKREFEYCYDHDGVYILSTHYHAFDRIARDGRTVRALINDIIDLAQSKSNIKYVGINEIW
ncbi:MAG TPA: DUF2334 domain-containing protein [bacterium]|nr:DUF2334 domain-containing protein [bacterium]